MARWIFMISTTALLIACSGAPEPDAGQSASEAWTAEQLRAFRQFKSDPAQRAATADTIARAFPAAFNYDELRVTQVDAALISQQRLVELLGQPSVSFSLVDRPEYFGANGRRSGNEQVVHRC